VKTVWSERQLGVWSVEWKTVRSVEFGVRSVEFGVKDS